MKSARTPGFALRLGASGDIHLEIPPDARERGSVDGASSRTVLESRLLEPFAFGGFAWDPVEALSATLARMDGELARMPDALRERARSDAVPLVLWCRAELDLARFARDALVREACDAAAGTGELSRFATFNDFERALHRAAAPGGLVPGRWKRWLAGEEYEVPRRAANARRAGIMFTRLDAVLRRWNEGGEADVARGPIPHDTATRQPPT
ncbi:MAG: hypothetical protein JXA15_09045 [Spirochaetales bacterium]|nr:hypothetical protein [Spirochaetales bacterium]